MQVKEILQKTTDFFRNKGFDSPRLETELLISSALHWERMQLYLKHEYPLNEQELNACRDFVRRRATGEPVAYIIGFKGFYKHSFKVTPAVLIPRPETEGLVDEALKFAQTNTVERVVDLGTGSGCVAIEVASALPGVHVTACDLSHDALQVAEENAQAIEVTEQITFVEKDASLFQASDVSGGLADIVLANPPYIDVDDPEVQPSVKKFEPSSALFSEEHGYADIRGWAKTAGRIARPGALIMFEIGHEQGVKAAQLFEQTGCFERISIEKDLAGLERFIRAYKKQEN